MQDYAAEARGSAVERWATAAKSFRMPYWDWAKADGAVPEAFMVEKIAVTRPAGYEQTIWNPLYTYYFHPLVPDGFEAKVRAPLSSPPKLTSDAVQVP